MNKNQKIKQFINQTIQYAQEKNPDFLYFTSLISVRQYKILYEKILDSIPSGKKVLDWGCGNGHFSYFLSHFDYNIVAYSLDKPPTILKETSKFKFVAGINEEPTKLPFNNNEFATVFSIGVLEHVRDTGGQEISSLKELYRITEPGGVFICAHLPNKLSWIEFAVNMLHSKQFTHLHRYNKKDIIKLWRAAGWKIELIKRYNWLPRNLFSHKFKSLANNRIVSAFYDLAESICKFFIYPFNQNYLVIAKKN